MHGRARETQMLEQVLAGARHGGGGALVARGEAGIGKTALLDRACEAADGFRVLTAQGVEFELELSFAGLHQLGRGLLDEIPHLPAPQRETLLLFSDGLIERRGSSLVTGMERLQTVTQVLGKLPLTALADRVLAQAGTGADDDVTLRALRTTDVVVRDTPLSSRGSERAGATF